MVRRFLRCLHTFFSSLVFFFFNVGNPLTCDCDTLWLRNWASESPSSSIRDEPRCYFPKALSGNPLRRLRSSRYVRKNHSCK